MAAVVSGMCLRSDDEERTEKSEAKKTAGFHATAKIDQVMGENFDKRVQQFVRQM
jgi:hypothetical protein